MALGLVLTFDDGRKEAVECSAGQGPADIMEARKAILMEVCDSLSSAKWQIESDPNGKF